MKYIGGILLAISLTCMTIPLWGEDNALFAILVIREDRILNETTEELFLLGQRQAETYIPLTNLPGSEETRRTLLNQYQDYIIFKHGQEVAQMNIEHIVLRPFDCFDEVVGVGTSNVPPDMREVYEWDWPLAMSGSDHGKRFDYRFNTYLTLNISSPLRTTQQHALPLPLLLDPRVGAQLLQLAESQMLQTYDGKYPLQTIDLVKYHAYDFEGDGTIEHLVTFSVTYAKFDVFIGSGVLVFHLDNGNIIPLLQSFSDKYLPARGFVDVLDLTGDAIPEIILKTQGYESIGFDVYTLKKKKFDEIFSFFGWGC
ncbi:MAG: hypothetical protein GY801_18185 [bacterium]|nr:hypothetical protein [bacterium]